MTKPEGSYLANAQLTRLITRTGSLAMRRCDNNTVEFLSAFLLFVECVGGGERRAPNDEFGLVKTTVGVQSYTNCVDMMLVVS